jgi:hypothetical protein
LEAAERQLPLVEVWEMEEPHCCKLLCCNTELVVRQSPASKEVNTEAKEAILLEVFIIQLVKTAD